MSTDPVNAGSVDALPVLDADTMEQLLSLDDGGTGLLEEMVGLFVEDTPPRIAALEAALAAGQWEAMADTAHAVKGAASTMGAPRVRALGQALETGGRKGTWPEPPASLVTRLRTSYEEANVALQAFLAARR